MTKKSVTKTENAQPTKRNRARLESSANKRKGNLVEEIAAMMHECAGVKVERNVFLSPINGDSNRKREIDVLLTSYVAGYEVRLAIECKNEAGVVGIEQIDAFVGKLDDVGIPHQHGIFISAIGYTSGAIDRARAKGIRTLALTGLTEDRLSAAVTDAWQHLVYLLPIVKQLTVFNHVAEGTLEIFGFQNDQGKLCGLLPDLIWLQWENREIGLTLGEREIELRIPSGWQQIINGKPEPPIKMTATVEVVGLALTISGKAREHSLIDVIADKTDRLHLQADFNTQRLLGRRLSLKRFFKENKLKAWVGKRGNVQLVNRIPLPRIQYLNRFYYPMSERVANIVFGQLLAFDNGQIAVQPVFSFNELEGSELKTAWEPIWQGHFEMWNQASRENNQREENKK